ncbi:tyrosine-type recombinase/integrase [Chromohalobacter sarecensis]|uniref:Tyrosine-type recombinase/integrase n=1 Tax=Chromohalobacter sarecensis TaxID=245294 RepID=A0ABV9CXP4_9GAMM|nr:site-specific integrase [Chromohalobacter sarecensis]MCK0715756.1 site-specific integrase [Chromohalobacter sarecensis]
MQDERGQKPKEQQEGRLEAIVALETSVASAPPEAALREVGSGIEGQRARHSAHISARTDVDAIALWLREFQSSPQTWRAYRKEAERLLLWLQQRGEGLPDVRRDTLDAYERFLADPQPASRWVGPSRPRADVDWRPFRQPLSAASRRQSLVILQGMFAWLVEAGWLEHNPFRLMRDKRRRMDNRSERIERYLERALWQRFWAWLQTPPSPQAGDGAYYRWARRRFLFGFAYLLAPRLGEVAQARMGDFVQREGRWWWRVVGKGDKLAEVPVPPDMMTLLAEWRMTLGVSPQPEPDDTTPLLRALDGRRGVGDNQLYRLIRETFRAGYQALDDLPEPTRAPLQKATPHWLRHTALTHQAQAGVELRYLARTARHARLDTTARYLHAEAEEWHRQLAHHRLADADTHDDGTL